MQNPDNQSAQLALLTAAQDMLQVHLDACRDVILYKVVLVLHYTGNITGLVMSLNLWYWPAIPKVHFSKCPLFRKSIVQICSTVLTFGLRLGLRSALGLGLGLVGIVDFWNSRPLE